MKIILLLTLIVVAPLIISKIMDKPTVPVIPDGKKIVAVKLKGFHYVGSGNTDQELLVLTLQDE